LSEIPKKQKDKATRPVKRSNQALSLEGVADDMACRDLGRNGICGLRQRRERQL